jgi:hypothetical protein
MFPAVLANSYILTSLLYLVLDTRFCVANLPYNPTACSMHTQFCLNLRWNQYEEIINYLTIHSTIYCKTSPKLFNLLLFIKADDFN